MGKIDVVEREAFVFLTPLDGGGTIEVRGRGEGEFSKLEVAEPTILSRYQFELKGRGPLFKPPSLDLVAAVTTKKIYLPTEGKDLFLAMLNHPNEEIIIEINHNDQFLLKMERNLNESGLLHEVLELLDLGQYEIRIKLKDDPGVSTQCEFEVAEYTMSPLFVKLEKYNFSKGGHVLKVEGVTLTILDQSYSGKVRVDRYCAYIHCKKVVDSLEVEFVNGKLKESFEFKGHNGPFTLYFTTEDGSTASAFIEQSRREERETIVFSELGPIIEASLVPLDEIIPTREIYIHQVGSKTSPFILEEVITSEAKIMATQDASLVQIVKVSPLNGGPVTEEYKEVKKGDVLTIKVDSPFSLFTIGAFLRDKNKPYAGQAVTVRPVEIGLTVDLPKQAKPGEEISIRLGANKPSDVLLVVTDARLISESPTKRLGKEIFNTAKENLAALELGPISEIEGLRMPSSIDLLSSVEEIKGAPIFPGGLTRGVHSFIAPGNETIKDQLASIARLGKVTVVAEEEIDLTPSRLEFPTVICCRLLKVEGEEVVKIELGDQIGQWKVSAYAFSGTDFVSQIREIVATQEAYVELDVPSILTEGSEVEGVARYKSQELATLKIYGSAVSPTIEKVVQGSGKEEFSLQCCGEVAVALKDQNGNLLDEVSRVISPPAQQTVTVARVQVLEPDQEIIAPEGGRVVVYPEWSVVQGEVTDSVVRYVTDHDCAEQTTTKLCALNLRRQSILTGGNGRGGELGRIEENMNMGVNRLYNSFFHKELFSLWPKGRTEVGVTHRVVRGLLPLREDFNLVKEMTQATISPLLKAEIRDNRLVVLDPAFRKGAPETIEDAVDLLEAEDSQLKEEALKFIKNSAILSKDGSTAYWTNTKSWGGTLEATCLAAKVLYQAKDPLFKLAFNYLAGRFVNGMLHSTADSQALLELLNIMKTEGNGRRGIIDGEEIEVSSLIIAQRVRAIDPLIVKIEEKKTINYLDLTPNFNFKVEIDKTNLELGEKVTIKIIALEESRCPESWVYLPANLAFLKGGANVQVRYIPLKTRETVEEAVAVRRGTAKGYVTLHDMYDAEKIGIAPGVPINVS